MANQVESAEQRRTLLELTKSAAIDSGDRTRAFQEICHAAAHGIQAARVSIWSYDREHEAIVCEELYERAEDRHSSGIVLHRKDFPAYFDYLLEERVLAAHDAHTDPATSCFSAPYLTPLGINSMLDAPIRLDGTLWGVVCHEHVGPHREWSVGEQLFGASMADFTARALAAQERAKAERDLAALNAELEERIAERTAELSKALDDLRGAQAQLVEREKLAALGALVAGVSHEVNTPLGVALTAATAWDEQLTPLRAAFEANQVKRSELERFFERSRQLSEVIRVNLGRAADLVRSFKQVAVRQSTSERETFALGEALDAAVASLRPEWKRRSVEVVVDADPLIEVHAPSSFVFQLTNNLVMNALLHAFPEGRSGTVHFRVRRTEATTVTLDYVDDGVGIGGEHLGRIWDPFFTTKRGAGGSGLGLNIVWNLVVGELGGRIETTSAPGEGLRITFTLPCLPTRAS
jgi:two-component system NtrC family sensor kinase